MTSAPSARATHAAIERLPASLRERHLAALRLVTLPGNVPPWTDTGIVLARDVAVSVLASGRLVLAPALDLWMRPSVALWGRVGGRGPLVNGARDTLTFHAAHDGALELALYNGEWGTPDGELATPVELYAGSGGEIDALVVRWQGDPVAGLAALAAALPDDPLLAGELDRLRHAAPPPEGWRHLWFLGESEIFRTTADDDRAAIAVDAANDVGILQRRLDFPLGPATTLAWRWRVDELPARASENDPTAHDYLSLALEFENGRDLTWYWSAVLPVGAHYACPLPGWTARETHWVVRSGADGIGRWHDERRVIADDYRAAVGEPPARVVAAWLIAVTLFGHRRGRATFADVVLRDGARELRVV